MKFKNTGAEKSTITRDINQLSNGDLVLAVYNKGVTIYNGKSFQLIDKANGDAVMGGSGPYNVSEIHQFSSSQGAQQAPITAASFANSGTSGMMSTDPIIVGSNGDNAFDLSYIFV